MVHPTSYALTSGSYYSHTPYDKFTRLWQASEEYLDVGAKSYRVSDLENLDLSEDNYSYTTWSEVALRIVKAVSYIALFPLALGALAIRTYYRSKWRVSEHMAEYKGISSFTLTPPGKPIPTLAELLAKQKAIRDAINPPVPAPERQPKAPLQPAFRDNFGDFPMYLPPTPPAPQVPLTTIESLGTQVAGNDHVRILERNNDADLPPTKSTVTDAEGHQYLYIQGNQSRDFLIRKG